MRATEGQSHSTREPSSDSPSEWRGIHLPAPGRSGLPQLKKLIDELLPSLKINFLVLEVNYGYAFESHPELRSSDPLLPDDAFELVALCRRHGIQLIPQFNCLGHQSWSKNTFPLLVNYPEFDETPEIPSDNPGIYCRSWCPLHPGVNEVAFALVDDLINAFQAESFHVGMDEVFLIASDQCTRCRGRDPAELFAKAVNDYHKHLVEDRRLTMLMWGDRLLDDTVMHYGKWEASQNGTARAVDHVPNDIIMCDWHYELCEAYPSVPFFIQKGFRVWPSSWRKPEAALALREYARGQRSERVLGHLCTTWGSVIDLERARAGDASASPNAQGALAALQACMET